MVTWIPSIYPSHVSIYTSTMDPMGITCLVNVRVFFMHLVDGKRNHGMDDDFPFRLGMS